MKKLATIEDLAKAVGGLASHFTKAAAHHRAVSDAHSALAEVHKGHHAFVKAKHEACADDDVNKAYFGKVAEVHAAKAAHHMTKAALHKAHAEHLDGMASELTEEKAAGAPAAAPAAGAPKAAGAPETPAAGSGVGAMIEKTTSALVEKALAALDTDPKVQERIQQIVLERVDAALGKAVVPDGVRGALPTPPGGGTHLIPRAGSAPVDSSAVDPTLQKMVQTTD